MTTLRGDDGFTRLYGRLDDGRWVTRTVHPYYLEVYALSNGWVDVNGCAGVRPLPDGREIVVMPWSRGAQLSVSHGRNGMWEDTWNYSTVVDAVAAADRWDGNGEPDDWYRHPFSGRRRPDGDAAREFYRP